MRKIKEFQTEDLKGIKSTEIYYKEVKNDRQK
jgi:hypothetical protein